MTIEAEHVMIINVGMFSEVPLTIDDIEYVFVSSGIANKFWINLTRRHDILSVNYFVM